MIARWPTGRCLREDIPGLTQTGDIARRFLEQQDQTSSMAVPFEGGTRPDTFTFHAGVGRGAVWQDRERGVLWLCCTSDQHDPGYAHGRVLAEDGQLYPDLAEFADGTALAPWGAHVDDDRIESLRFVDSALTTFAAVTCAAGSPTDLNNAIGFMRLSVDEDSIWTLTIR